MVVVRHWNRLPREAGECWETFKSQLDTVLTACSRQPCFDQDVGLASPQVA